MPKVKWIGTAPPEDKLKTLFGRYKKERKLKSDELGELMNKSGDAVRAQLYRGTDCMSVADVRNWCEALGITSAEEIGKAILRN